MKVWVVNCSKPLSQRKFIIQLTIICMVINKFGFTCHSLPQPNQGAMNRLRNDISDSSKTFARTIIRARRSSGTGRTKGPSCTQSLRDVSAVKDMLLDSANIFTSPNTVLFHGIRILDVTEHRKAAISQPNLAIHAMIEFLNEFTSFLHLYAHKNKNQICISKFRSLLIKIQKLKTELASFPSTNNLSNSENQSPIQELMKEQTQSNVPLHVVALLRNLNYSLARVCPDGTSITI